MSQDLHDLHDIKEALAGIAPELGRVLTEVCELVAGAGGRAWLVGGSVRDLAMGRLPVDLDLEVFGLSEAGLLGVLEEPYELVKVGQCFGIFKLRGWPLDVGLPRRETKTGTGHRGFDVAVDPGLDLPAAAARRDFTVNAVYFDPLTAEVADPWSGLCDLQRRCLRHTSPAFAEDPLRVLRGMQLAARFELDSAPETVALCRDMTPEGLAPERIWGEWMKLITRGVRPSLGLGFIEAGGWLSYFPLLEALRGCPQDPVHHPEGDVWTHTLCCLDAFARERTGDVWEDVVVGFAVLCHDLGKPETTIATAAGRIRAAGHDVRSAALAGQLIGNLGGQPQLVQAVVPLVAEHMKPSQLYRAQASPAAVRRLATRVGRIDRLVRLARADNFGRPPLPDDIYPAGDWLLAQAEALDVRTAPPSPLVLGRHLIDLGAAPGPGFGTILERIYDAQLAGKITTVGEGVALARKLLP